MPANLTPDYLAAEARFRAAETTEEKLRALEEMYATIPKHKGTEKLQADIKRRISKLRDKERQAAKHGKRTDEFYVLRQGAGQVILIGPPNSGKSSILARLTSATPEIAEYPFTTRRPVPGMMEFEDILIQLVDTPPIYPGSTERGIVGLTRGADSIALVLDASDDALLDQIEETKEELSKSKAVLVGEHATEKDYPPGTAAKPTLIVANKIDRLGASDNLDVLREFYGEEYTILPVSAATGEGLEDLRAALFRLIGVIRVYTKVPGKPPDMERPFTLKKGSTLMDFAAAVHKDFVRSLRFAKAWGPNLPDGTQIGRDHVLEDGYVIELHA
jgi:ribosome-interacting GTPase 1